ncbi:MmgE/PrpD family protein [Pseudochelatococcus sp. B33]
MNERATATIEFPDVDSDGITRQLARFVAGLDAVSIPSAVRQVLQVAVLDAVGCGLYGLTTQTCRIVQSYAADQGGPPEASLWASGGQHISVGNVALAAGTAVHGFDFDDHSRAKIHPGAAVIPAALALAERNALSGAEFLVAIAAGYEVMNRVSLAADPNSARMRGWHLTGTTGTFGVAASASRLLDLDAETTASALGLAGTQSSGLWAFNADGAMSKRIHPGLAGRSGLMAAELAARGFHGPRFILEAEDGGFLAAMSDKRCPEEAVRELGNVWRTEKTCFKPYACCGSNHAAIDAALQLISENNLSAESIDRIEVGVSAVVERQTGFPYVPSTVLNAQMSIRFNVAVAIIDRNALVEQFTSARIVDPAVCDLAARVNVVIDPEMDAVYPRLYAGIVTLKLKDGRSLTRRVDHSLGMPEAPMSTEAMTEKFMSLAGTAIGFDAARDLLTELQSIFDAPDVRPIAERIGSLTIRDP